MISFVIPTMNEPEIQVLIGKIKGIIASTDLEIIIIDHSDDDTFERALKAGAKVYAQQSSGLGGALIEGLSKACGDIIFTMDADLSHDPQYIPTFLEQITAGYDVVVGSRKLKGGQTEGWGIKRKMISSGANFVGKYIAGVNVSDLTSGYRAYTLNAVQSLDFNLFTAKGFSFQLEILFHLLKNGFKVTAIPIKFPDRRAGKSKLTRKEVSSFLKTAIRLFLMRLQDH